MQYSFWGNMIVFKTEEFHNTYKHIIQELEKCASVKCSYHSTIIVYHNQH